MRRNDYHPGPSNAAVIAVMVAVIGSFMGYLAWLTLVAK